MRALLLLAGLAAAAPGSGVAAPERWDESKNAALLERVARQARENVERRGARAAPVAAQARPSGVAGDARVELYAAVLLLAERSPELPPRWAGLSGHPAVVSAARLLEADARGLLPLRLALSLPLDGAPAQPVAEGHAAKAGGPEKAREFLRDLSAFAARARFEEWLEETRWERRSLEESLSAQAGELAAAARYLGPSAACVRLVPSVLLPAARAARLDAAGPRGDETWLLRAAASRPPQPGEAARELLYASINRLDPGLPGAWREEAVKALSRRIAGSSAASPAEERLLEYEKDRARYPALADFWPRLRPVLGAR